MPTNDPVSAKVWLQYAYSNLRLAEQGHKVQGVLLEDLCFNAQQAAEKALKAVCVAYQIEFPKTHSLIRLVDILTENGITIPGEVREASILTQYAVQARYPGWAEEVTRAEYQEAVHQAAYVVFWAETVVQQATTKTSSG